MTIGTNLETFAMPQPTLRDQFAMAALVGICMADTYFGKKDEYLAAWAYALADAMLKAREVQPCK